MQNITSACRSISNKIISAKKYFTKSSNFTVLFLGDIYQSQFGTIPYKFDFTSLWACLILPPSASYMKLPEL